MTVVAWDGKTLAADTQSDTDGMRGSARKLHEFKDADGSRVILGFAGAAALAGEMVAWIVAGAEPSAFPDACRGEHPPCTVMAILDDGTCVAFENSPYPVIEKNRFWAIGSGAPYALTAMHLGFDARKAVEIASELCTYCGGSVDALEFDAKGSA